ncbi:MAG: hypothetical protein HS108_14480 [Planctomycetes bacterium]|nr:hypothetical protein [Planctomycetota bacterium]
MSEASRLVAFIEQYKAALTNVLEPTAKEVKTCLDKFKHRTHWESRFKGLSLPIPSPVSRLRTRVKRPESVVDKIKRKPDHFPLGLHPDSIHAMHDAVGARLVLYFPCHLKLIHDEITKSPDLEVCPDDLPVAYVSDNLSRQYGLVGIQQQRKESGYISLHYILRLKQSSVPLASRPWFELQVRTIIEDAWGEIEHVLGYKPSKHAAPAMKRHFELLSRHLEAIDDHFTLVYEHLLQQQADSATVELMADAPLSPENLPRLLSEMNIRCSQFEIDGLLKILFSAGVRSVGDLRGACSTVDESFVRNMYTKLTGVQPNGFELIHALASIRYAKTPEEKEELIRINIEVARYWREHRHDVGASNSGRYPSA